MAVIKIIELVGSSPTSSDDAVKAALSDAQRDAAQHQGGGRRVGGPAWRRISRSGAPTFASRS